MSASEEDTSPRSRKRQRTSISQDGSIFSGANQVGGTLYQVGNIQGNLIIRGNELDVLVWLSPTPHDNRHNEIKSRRIKGTGMWLLERLEYKRWRLESDASSFLWCHGGPGTGKTALTSLVVDQLLSAVGDHTGVAYVYLDYANRKAQTVECIIASFTKQLSMWKRSNGDVQRLYEQCQKGTSRPDLSQLASTLQAVCNGFQHVFLVLDALDECEDERRALLLAQLGSLDQSRCRFFLTSRPHLLDLQKSLRDSPQISIKAQDSDIRLLIQKRIEDDSALSELVENNERLKAAIVDGIIKNAKDMFLLATLQLDAIAQSTTEYEVEEELKRMLLWLSQARRPLSLQELSQAVAVDVGEVYLNKKKTPKEGIMTRVCMGLVVVDRDTSVIRLVHYSMQEYLHTHFERSESGLIFVEKDMIVKTCLTILLFDEFGKGECKSDTEFELRVQEYPVFFYAAANWTYHAGSERNDGIRQLALRFLRDKHKVSSAIQAIMVDGQYRFEGYSQKFPDKFTGLHMAAYYGLKESVSLLVGDWKIDGRDGYERTPLSYATENGHEAVVEQLLAKDGVDLDSEDKYGQTPLWLAVENGHEAVVKQLLAKDGVDPNSGNIFGQTPLWLAVEKGHETTIGLLLAKDSVDPNTMKEYGWTPLSWASENGHEAVVKLLLAKDGVDLTYSNFYGQTPLSLAARNGHEAVVRLLLAKGGVDPDSRDNDGRTSLSWAASNGHEAVVRLLFAEGVDLDFKDDDGRMPLLWAIENGHEAVVKFLLATDSVGLNSKDNGGRTPLSLAARNGHEAMVRLLLATDGVDLDSENGDGQTPLSLAVRYGHRAVVVRLLFAKDGVELDSEDGEGQMPLSRTVISEHDAVVRLLLATDSVNLNNHTIHGQMPLSWAARHGCWAVVKLLLARNSVDPDFKDGYGQTPLSWAARNGHEAVVKLLLVREGVDPDSKDRSGRTPLCWAAQNGHEAVVKLLLAREGVDPDSKDGYGQTPLSWAARTRHEAVVKLLQSQHNLSS